MQEQDARRIGRTAAETARRDDYIEEARRLERLMQLGGLSQAQLARRVGMSQPAVANKLRLLRHTPAVLAALREHQLSERHARALLRLRDEALQLRAVEQIVAGGLNVARTEQYIDGLLEALRPGEPSDRGLSVFFSAVDRELSLARSAGVDAACGREETDSEIILTIRVSKRAG